MSYRVPHIPSTPSTKINNLLQSRFGHSPDNPIKSVTAHYICAIFHSITLVYKCLRRGSPPPESYPIWLVSCALVSVVLSITWYLVYTIIMSASCIVKASIAYGMTGLALIAIAMGICGAVFFDRASGSETAKAREEGSRSARLADQTLGYHQPSANVIQPSGNKDE